MCYLQCHCPAMKAGCQRCSAQHETCCKSQTLNQVPFHKWMAKTSLYSRHSQRRTVRCLRNQSYNLHIILRSNRLKVWAVLFLLPCYRNYNRSLYYCYRMTHPLRHCRQTTWVVMDLMPVKAAAWSVRAAVFPPMLIFASVVSSIEKR